jgi:ferric-dicitrate binding protein FerR (iron transport regulator)
MSIKLTQEQIREYADKWLKGTITSGEKELFEQWYNARPPESIAWNTDEKEEEVKEKIFSGIKNEISDEAVPFSFKENKRTVIWRMAAGIAAILVISLAIWKWTGNSKEEKLVAGTVYNKATLVIDKMADYTRHLVLPDGSTVILNANSKLDLSGNFSGNTREVILVGEAYFDIAHDEKKPFIIHTGQIKTTVLGTAFNINAYPDAKKITISVTRGKVKVENNKKVLGVLIPDQQITCNVMAAVAEQHPVNATTIVTDWTKQDMAFEDVSFEKIIQLLNRRYGVDISFNNPALRNCTIKAFFNGTESLEKVLDVLCIISNASYVMAADHKTIVLDGKGCEENN